MTDRELDALVAEKVMGCKVSMRLDGPRCSCEDNGWPHRDDYLPLLRYSTDISAAWRVVEKIMHDPAYGVGSIDITRCFERELAIGPSGYSVWLGANGAWATDVPRAICLAALRAVGVDVTRS